MWPQPLSHPGISHVSWVLVPATSACATGAVLGKFIRFEPEGL